MSCPHDPSHWSSPRLFLFMPCPPPPRLYLVRLTPARANGKQACFFPLPLGTHKQEFLAAGRRSNETHIRAAHLPLVPPVCSTKLSLLPPRHFSFFLPVPARSSFLFCSCEPDNSTKIRRSRPPFQASFHPGSVAPLTTLLRGGASSNLHCMCWRPRLISPPAGGSRSLAPTRDLAAIQTNFFSSSICSLRSPSPGEGV